MGKTILRWLGTVLIAGILGAPVQAQTPAPGQPAETERRPPAPEYAVAFFSAIIILVIICMPSRKQ